MSEPVRAQLWLPADHWINPAATAIFKRTAGLLGWQIVASGSSNITNQEVIFNFLRRARIPPNCQSRAINIHPASGCYPGVGGASRALLEGATRFGACAHLVTERYDEGDIVWEEGFIVDHKISAEGLLFAAELLSLRILTQAMMLVAREGIDLQSWSKAVRSFWRGPYCSRTALKEKMTVDVGAGPEVIGRVVRAFHYPGKPGPYLRFGGHLFSLVVE